MSDDPEIYPRASTLVAAIRQSEDVDFSANEILLLVNEWKNKAWSKGFEAGKESK